ncbi:MAG TPA: DNA repair protein RecN [Chitinophagaceae bacterium]|nr:DNA repair protein RecN [Chitinophagaceae bacterium]
MLQKLFIQNYALISELVIDFSGKLNIITGETGAGKSIIVGALDLILGGRADSSVLLNKEKKCIVEGSFATADKNAVRSFLSSNDLDWQEELVIRREIGSNGKSRAFINDTPVTLTQLNKLSSLLVDLHQQFDTLELGESDFQRNVLDALAGLQAQLEDYRQIFRQWQTEKKALEDLQQQKKQFDKEADYNRFQFTELEEAAFRENELEEVEAELKMLSNAEGIKTALTKAYFELEESDAPVVQQLKSLYNQLQAYSDCHPALPDLLRRIQSVQIELQDIADETDSISQHVQYDPQRVEQMNERLSLGYKLLKKHGVKTTTELLAVQHELEQKLQAVLNIDENIRQTEAAAVRLQEQAQKMAAVITAGRKKQVKPLEEKVNNLLVKVGMPNARLKVDIKPESINLSGADAVDFLFNANLPSGEAGKNSSFAPIRKVASGGELSRLMLCIKSLVAQSVDLPTLIFDEIDTGISGEAARQVGIIIKNLAASRQVICITHQPQIAGKADAHYFVYKEIQDSMVKTNIRLLTSAERITAIAKMLGGEKPTAAAIENAREMVNN